MHSDSEVSSTVTLQQLALFPVTVLYDQPISSAGRRIIVLMENDEDVDDWFGVETGDCGAADVLYFNNSLTEGVTQYRSSQFIDLSFNLHRRR